MFTRSRVAAVFAILAVSASSAVSVSVAGSTTSPGTAAQVSSLVSKSVTINTVDSAIAALLPGLRSDNYETVFSLAPNAACLTATQCVFGDKAATKTVVLYGDSHARQWLAAINPNAVKNHLKLVLVGKEGCPVIAVNLTLSKYAGCNADRATAQKLIVAMKPSAVILADRTATTGLTKSTWQAGMIAAVKALRPSGARLVILEDIQVFTNDPAQCLATYPGSIQAHCSIKNPNPVKPALEAAEKAAASATKTLYVPTSHWICTSTACSPVVGNFITHFDNSHLTASYAAYLSGVMGTALKKSFGG